MSRDVTTPLKGQFVIPMLNCHIAHQCTKFEVSSFSRYGDIIGGMKNLNVSHDHNHVFFWGGWFFIFLAKLDIVSLLTKFDSSSFSHSWDMDVTTSLSEMVCRLKAVNSYTNLCTKFEVSFFTQYKDMNGDEKCRNWGGLKVIGNVAIR